MDPMMPPPCGGSRSTATRTSPPSAPAATERPGSRGGQAPAHRAPPWLDVRERMRIEAVWLAYGENWVVRDVRLPVRQGEVLA